MPTPISALPATQVISWAAAPANLTPLVINPSLTGSAANAALSITPTWNTSGAPTAISLSVTDTASAASSLLMDLRAGAAGASSAFRVRKDGLASAVYHGFLSGIGGAATGYIQTNGDGVFQFRNAAGTNPTSVSFGTQTIFTPSAGGLIISDTTAGFCRVSAYTVRDTNASAGLGDCPLGGQAKVFLGAASAVGWSSNIITAGTMDLFLWRDAANTLAQRNGTTAQTFRVYGSFTDASNGDWLNITKAAGGSATIATQANGAGVAGSIVLSPGGSNTVTFDTFGGISASSSVLCSAAAILGFTGRSRMRAPADGQLTLGNAAETDFGRLNFGGTTSSFPALKRSSDRLQVRLADDSANAGIDCGTIRTNFYQDAGGSTRIDVSGGNIVAISASQILTLPAGSTSRAQLNLASSTAPTSPNNGDIWFDGTDLKMRVGGVTKTFTLV